MNTVRTPRAGRSPARRDSLRVRRGSWISLFAMLMIFIGPLISQAMPMNHAMPMPAHQGMDMAAQDPACHDATATHHAPAKSPAQPQMLWEKCGYCGLLYNCPALPGSIAFNLFDSPPPLAVTTPAPRLGHARQAVFPGARSRAPPIVA